jgi:hypothetical protein
VPPKSAAGRDPGAKRDPEPTGKGGGSGDRQAPPPLWSSKSRDEAPAMPFWLRPVKRDDDREE